MILYVLLVMMPCASVCFADQQEFYLKVPDRCAIKEGGRVLSGHYKEVGANSRMECAAACMRSQDCSSVDYSATNGSCRQYSDVTADNCSNVMEAKGYIHYDMVSKTPISANHSLESFISMSLVVK